MNLAGMEVRGWASLTRSLLHGLAQQTALHNGLVSGLVIELVETNISDISQLVTVETIEISLDQKTNLGN